MKKSIFILTKILAYGVFVPLTVLFLADLSIKLTCKYYWGEYFLLGHSGFKLGMWLMFLFLYLTIFYYIFCALFFFLKRQKRKWVTIFFLVTPIILYELNSEYDYRITICFSLFHLTYYGLFFISSFFLKKFGKILKVHTATISTDTY